MFSLNVFLFMINLLQLLVIHSSLGQNDECMKAETCQKCINSSVHCFWCADENFKNNDRCYDNRHVPKSICPLKIMDPINENKMIEDNDFSETIGSTVQLKPQKYEISLRAHSEIIIPIHFRQANDYPMDLYYLMDLSCTMKDHKTNLAKVGETIAKKISETTKNFQIGFGSFVDKTVMPYCAYKIESLNCGGKYSEQPYSFAHRMSLNSNASEFKERVSKADTSGNTDGPEGTLDALMQVLVCKDEIGWRSQSDKIIVVATDAEFHYAGDGKLGGIVVPNDGKCHLLNNNYTHWQLLDYPSMHHIAQKVRENKFNVVFAVHPNVEKIYQTLVNIIGSTAQTAKLINDSQTIVKMIDDVYKDIRSYVNLTIDEKPDNIDIEFFSNCESATYMKRSECPFTGKPTITFDAKIKMTSCPQDRSKWNQKIIIGLKNNDESVQIDLRMNCECDCEKPENAKPDSEKCSNAGTYACGICSCNGIRSGITCECDPEKPINASDPNAYCRSQVDANPCSGRGTCTCANCECREEYSGKFCQFDDKGCYEPHQKQKCNGRNGECIEGRCNCTKEFEGQFCQCPVSKSTCIAFNTTLVCSGIGNCECGECKCKSSRIGKYCRKCPACDSKQICDRLASCVPGICKELNSIENCKLKTQNCTQLNYTIVEHMYELSNSSSEYINKFQCQTRTPDNDCDILFTYERTDGENNEELSFKIIKATRTCAVKPNLLVYSIGVIAGVILVGLALLLIWKLITETLDKKEFARFQKEINKANWDQSENPLYKEVTTTFTNPTFGVMRGESTKKV